MSRIGINVVGQLNKMPTRSFWLKYFPGPSECRADGECDSPVPIRLAGSLAWMDGWWFYGLLVGDDENHIVRLMATRVTLPDRQAD